MTPKQAKLDSPGADMSAAAVEQRLRDLAQLYKLGTVIDESRRLGKFRNLVDGPAQIGTVQLNEDAVVR